MREKKSNLNNHLKTDHEILPKEDYKAEWGLHAINPTLVRTARSAGQLGAHTELWSRLEYRVSLCLGT